MNYEPCKNVSPSNHLEDSLCFLQQLQEFKKINKMKTHFCINPNFFALIKLPFALPVVGRGDNK